MGSAEDVCKALNVDGMVCVVLFLFTFSLWERPILELKCLMRMQKRLKLLRPRGDEVEEEVEEEGWQEALPKTVVASLDVVAGGQQLLLLQPKKWCGRGEREPFHFGRGGRCGRGE